MLDSKRGSDLESPTNFSFRNLWIRSIKQEIRLESILDSIDLRLDVATRSTNLAFNADQTTEFTNRLIVKDKMIR